MVSEAEGKGSPRRSKLPLSIIPIPMASPERSGTATPPLQTTASVPFRWEEEPGKPKNPCATLSKRDFAQKCLELPPRLLLLDVKSTKLPSPSTALDGPYHGHGRVKHESSSFRMAKECYGAGSSSPEGKQLGALVLSKGWQKPKEKGFLFGAWGKKKMSFKGKKEINGGSYIFPSLLDRDSEGSSRDGGEEVSEKTNVKLTRVKRAGSHPVVPQAKSHFWSSIYENLRQVVPWKRRKMKRQEVIVQSSSMGKYND